MIRINLLPVREAVQKRAGKQFLLLAVVLLLGQAGLLFYLQSEAGGELDRAKQSNAQIQSKITALQAKTREVAELQSEKEQLEKQKGVLDALVEGKSGPVRVLFAMASILRRVEDPEEKLRVQNLGWNPDWDPKSLWIETLVEQRRLVKVGGVARSNEDIAEFLRRLNSSKHFVQVELRVTEAFPLPELKGTRLMRFDVEAVALYGPGDVKKLADGSLTQADSRRRRR